MKKSDNIEINGTNFRKFLTSRKISKIVSELAERINEDLQGLEPVFLLVLNGSIFFGVDLLRKISLECTIKTISAKSYGNKMKSSGEVSVESQKLDIAGKVVVIIEDIIDSGHTIKAIIAAISKLKPDSVKIVTLLDKPSRREVNVIIDYVGIEIPDTFVIGYGLDYAEKGRNLPDIYALEDVK